MILNTCAGGLTFYGLCSLRYQWDSILIAISIMSLHALIAHQFAIWCVWANQTQVSFILRLQLHERTPLQQLAAQNHLSACQ